MHTTDADGTAPPHSDAPTGPGTARVLVVEDDTNVREFLRRGLQLDDHSVDSASTGTEALCKLETRSYDVMVTDVNLPGPSGLKLFEFCKSVAPDTEVIIITGKPSVEDAFGTAKGGAFDYLQKPIRLGELRERVRSALRLRTERRCATLDATVAVEQLPLADSDSYRVVRRLGAGTAAIVLLVERNGGLCAMKLLKMDAGSREGKKQLKRFLREGAIVSKLQHPGIVQVYECGYSPGRGGPHIIMEYVDGPSLKDLIDRRAVHLDTALSILIQVTEALAAIHAAGITHRDLKPGNILVTTDWRAKISDFGIACLGPAGRITGTVEILGSPSYMSPEGFAGARDIDHRSDLFSLGIVAYELLTGLHPFQGDTLAEVMHAIIGLRPAAPTNIVPALPVALQNVLGRLLAKKAEHRYGSADEILIDLRQIEQAHMVCRIPSMQELHSIPVWG